MRFSRSETGVVEVRRDRARFESANCGAIARKQTLLPLSRAGVDKETSVCRGGWLWELNGVFVLRRLRMTCRAEMKVRLELVPELTIRPERCQGKCSPE